MVKDTDWTDQGWGNEKARLFIRLYRGGGGESGWLEGDEELIKEEDIFGICDRSGTQKDKTYGEQDEIVNKA